MQIQSVKSKLGEIRYRQKISRQHTGQKIYVEAEPNQIEMRQILSERLYEYQKTFSDLKRKNLLKSPFLEIGAEYCLASSLLVNKFNNTGVALDISIHSLANAAHFSKIFHFSRTPAIICADANNLPFARNTFPFVFVYESLHHFPDPLPVLKEIYRVMTPGGVCLIGNDPIAQTFQLKLWHRPTKLRPWEKILKTMLILPFISHIGKTEAEHQIIEDAFPLNVWENSLSIFDHVEITIQSRLGFNESLSKSENKNWLSPKLTTRLSLNILGGGLQAICFKYGQGHKMASKLDNLLICPQCFTKKHQEKKLFKIGQLYICRNCNSHYGKHSGVLTLLNKDLEKSILQIANCT